MTTDKATTTDKQSLEPLELALDSEFPTERAPERAALAARIAIQSLAVRERESWFDSEAPTGVVAERPIFPPSPRAPRV